MNHKKLSRPGLYVNSSELQRDHPETCIKMVNMAYWCPSQISVFVSILGASGSRIRAKENPALILLGQNMPKFYLSQFQLKKDHHINSARRYQRFPKS